MTKDNAYTFDHLRQLEKLTQVVGGMDECKRLGFVHIDGQGVQSLSTAGMGFLIYNETGHALTKAEAFAAGWQAAKDEDLP